MKFEEQKLQRSLQKRGPCEFPVVSEKQRITEWHNKDTAHNKRNENPLKPVTREITRSLFSAHQFPEKTSDDEKELHPEQMNPID